MKFRRFKVWSERQSAVEVADRLPITFRLSQSPGEHVEVFRVFAVPVLPLLLRNEKRLPCRPEPLLFGLARNHTTNIAILGESLFGKIKLTTGTFKIIVAHIDPPHGQVGLG